MFVQKIAAQKVFLFGAISARIPRLLRDLTLREPPEMPYPQNRDGKSANVVADHFLLKIDVSSGDTISNLKMQKLCYFSQVASLVHKEESLFDDEIQAWAHGPVIPNLYKRFRRYGWQAIDPTDLRTHPDKFLDEAERRLLDKVWGKLSGYTAKYLEQLSHKDEAWKRQYTPEKPGGRCSNVIAPQHILEFYNSGKQPSWLKSIG